MEADSIQSLPAVKVTIICELSEPMYELATNPRYIYHSGISMPLVLPYSVELHEQLDKIAKFNSEFEWKFIDIIVKHKDKSTSLAGIKLLEYTRQCWRRLIVNTLDEMYFRKLFLLFYCQDCNLPEWNRNNFDTKYRCKPCQELSKSLFDSDEWKIKNENKSDEQITIWFRRHVYFFPTI